MVCLVPAVGSSVSTNGVYSVPRADRPGVGKREKVLGGRRHDSHLPSPALDRKPDLPNDGADTRKWTGQAARLRVGRRALLARGGAVAGLGLAAGAALGRGLASSPASAATTSFSPIEP